MPCAETGLARLSPTHDPVAAVETLTRLAPNGTLRSGIAATTKSAETDSKNASALIAERGGVTRNHSANASALLDHGRRSAAAPSVRRDLGGIAAFDIGKSASKGAAKAVTLKISLAGVHTRLLQRIGGTHLPDTLGEQYQNISKCNRALKGWPWPGNGSKSELVSASSPSSL